MRHITAQLIAITANSRFNLSTTTANMTATTHPEFNDKTESLDVAKAFANSVHGKNIIVTGVNKLGIGYSTAEALASQGPANLILASRTPSKVQECIEAIQKNYPNAKCRALQVDLSSQKSVRRAAREVLGWDDVPTVDIMVNSAGIHNIPQRTLSEDGIELHLATNHIGHYLLTCLLMPKLIAAAKGNPAGATRVVNVTSLSPLLAKMRWSDYNFDKKSKDLPPDEQPAYAMLERWGFKDAENKSYVPLEGYNQSKVANVLFSIGLTRRVLDKHGILSIAAHPGIIGTELARFNTAEQAENSKRMVREMNVEFRTLGAGASTSLVAALDPKLGQFDKDGASENHGAYMIDCQISDQANPLAVSSAEAEKLWSLSERLVKQEFSW